MRFKQWWKRRKELKKLEKAIDRKINEEGMYYMFKDSYMNRKTQQ